MTTTPRRRTTVLGAVIATDADLGPILEMIRSGIGNFNLGTVPGSKTVQIVQDIKAASAVGTTGDKAGFVKDMRDTQRFTDIQIEEILQAAQQATGQAPSPQMFKTFWDGLGRIQDELDKLGVRVTDVETGLAKHVTETDRRFADHDERITRAHALGVVAVDALKAQDKKIDAIGRVRKGLLWIPIVVGILTWFVCQWIGHRASKVYGMGNQAHTQTGMSAAPWGWIGLGIALVMSALVLLLVQAIPAKPEKPVQQATTDGPRH